MNSTKIPKMYKAPTDISMDVGVVARSLDTQAVIGHTGEVDEDGDVD